MDTMRTMVRWAAISVLVSATGACSKSGTQAPPQAAPTPTTSAEAEPVQTPDEHAPIVVSEAGFMTPESILYDAEADVYLVSNVNGKPTDVDDNGFISRVRPDGSIENLKWIDGAAEGVDLNAPKGMTISGDTLYVADITFIRRFDRTTGEPKGSVTVRRATFLNDVTATADGTVYFTDSGLTPTFEPSGSDAIYRIGKNGKSKLVVKNAELGHPNGIVATDTGIWVATWGGEIYRITEQGAREEVKKLDKGQLDGIVRTTSGKLLVSSWEGSLVYGTDNDTFTPVVNDVESPADIGYDTKRERVLIPLFKKDAIQIQPL